MKVFRSPLLLHLQRVFWRSPWAAELGGALTAISWAVLSYAAPTDMEAWPSMLFLLRLAPDEFWQAAGFSLGFWQLVFLALDSRWGRWGMALALGWFWSLLAMGVWLAVPWAPGVAVYAGWVAVSVFSVLRLLRPGG